MTHTAEQALARYRMMQAAHFGQADDIYEVADALAEALAGIRLEAVREMQEACKALVKWREGCKDLPTDIPLIGAYQLARAALKAVEK